MTIIFTYLSPVNVYVNKVEETDIRDVFKTHVRPLYRYKQI